ncbi:MAG: histidine kinase dimerization/phospho-acceptor domain-containing protein, partial [Elainellaceae cyanobacterium]
MSSSQEFLELCQAQLKLLVQGLDLSFGMIYLATDSEQEGRAPTLVPVAAYPEAAMSRDVARLLPEQITPETMATELSADSDGDETIHPNEPQTTALSWRTVTVVDALRDAAWYDATVVVDSPAELEAGQVYSKSKADLDRSSDGRVLIPLTYRDVVLGLVVLDRVSQTWTAAEQHQIENVTHSLAAGYMIDRRSRWLNQKLQEQHLAYEAFHEQQDTMLDTLLHQLRNPLTAVQTFGKLLLRRIQPGEANRTAAEGIVRESDRIRLLLEQFSQIMASLPPTLPSADIANHMACADSYDATGSDSPLPNRMPPPPANSDRQAIPDADSPAVSSQLLTGGPLELQPLDLSPVLIP